MIDLIRKSEKVLLVGEGNFSFTIALLNRALKSSSYPTEVVSSCFQKFKELCPDIRANALDANRMGEHQLSSFLYGVPIKCCVNSQVLKFGLVWMGHYFISMRGLVRQPSALLFSTSLTLVVK